jgi:hypothetical protein
MATRLALSSVAGGVAARSGKSLASVGEVFVMAWPPGFGAGVGWALSAAGASVRATILAVGVSGGSRHAELGPASGGCSATSLHTSNTHNIHMACTGD